MSEAQRYTHHTLIVVINFTGDSVRTEDRSRDGATVHWQECYSCPVCEVVLGKEGEQTCHPSRQVRTLHRCSQRCMIGIKGKRTLTKQVYSKLDECIAHF